MTRADFGELPAVFADVAIAAARAVVAGRRLLLSGPPGCGKTMVARRLASILSLSDHAETWLRAEYEGANLALAYHSPLRAPFRAPHHTVAAAALAGGGPRATKPYNCRCGLAVAFHAFHELPGSLVGRAAEVDLARFGVLFLDELVEFTPLAIDSLAIRLEAMGSTAPRIVAASNTCPCGWSGFVGAHTCSCGDEAKKRYRKRIEKFCDVLKIAERVDVVATSALLTAGEARCPTTAEIIGMIGDRP